MNMGSSYRKSFIFAIGLHLGIAALLFTESSPEKAVLNLDASAHMAKSKPVVQAHEKEVIKALTVNDAEVQATLSRLKEARAKKEQMEIAHQTKLAQEAKQAKIARLKEQQRLTQLKKEADEMALMRKKQVQEEKKRLQELAKEKAQEENRLAALKKEQEKLKAERAIQQKQQQEEARRLAELNKKAQQEAELNKKAQQEAELKRQELAREEAARTAAKQAQIAGEVNKYKALIINAISQQWILPEQVDKSLSSQFRIRLAPDGMVLEVSLIRSSGDAILDRSAQSAIYKASPLPVPQDAESFNLFRNISLTVRPEQVRG